MKEYHAEKGMSFCWAVSAAKGLIEITSHDVVRLIFNDVALEISLDSNESDIAEIYRLKCKCGEYEK